MPLPDGWSEVSLAELMQGSLFTDGDWIETKDQDPEGGIRLIQLADVGEGTFRDRSSRFVNAATVTRLNCTPLERRDVLVARMPEPLGRACLVPDLGIKAITAVDVCILRPDPRLADPIWLMWAINSPEARSQILALQTGTTRKRISRKNLGTIRLRLPPLPEQQRIVAAIEEQFSRLDAAEVSLRQLVAKKRIFRGTALEAAFEHLPDSAPLGDVAVSISDGPFGSNLKSSHYTDRGPRVIRLANIGEGVFVDEKAHITPEHFGELQKYAVREGDVVIASLGSTALRSCVVPDWILPAIVKADCIRVRLSEKDDPRYINFALQRPSVWRQARTLIHGVGRPRLGVPAIRTLPVPSASPDEQRAVIDLIESQLSIVDAIGGDVESSLTRSSVLRQAILAEAFSGRLVVHEEVGKELAV